MKKSFPERGLTNKLPKAAGNAITKQESEFLELELFFQLLTIQVSRTQGCIQVAPDHVCEVVCVCKGSLWITCFAAELDQVNPVPVGKKARGPKVFDELIDNGYVGFD